jgi:hypothetical protein
MAIGRWVLAMSQLPKADLQHPGKEALAAHSTDQIHDCGRTFIVMDFDLVLMRAVGLLDATHGFEGGSDFADGLGCVETFDA